MIDYAILASVIAEPQFAAYQPDGTVEICAILNAQTTSMCKESFVNERTMLAAMGLNAIPILNKLDLFVADAAPAGLELLHNATKRVMKFIYSDSGIDFGHANTQAQLDALAAASVLTTSEVASLKAMGLKPASRAEVLFGVGTVVTSADIRAAQEV